MIGSSRSSSPRLQLLVLVIYSPPNPSDPKSRCNDQMLELQRAYLHKFRHQGVTTFFVRSDENMDGGGAGGGAGGGGVGEGDVRCDGDMISVRGPETYMNILRKTLLAVSFLIDTRQLPFDFLLRGNISTIANIPPLLARIRATSFPDHRENVYAGSIVHHQSRREPGFGIVDSTFFGTRFVEGSGILVSRDVAECMVNPENYDKYHHDLIDDVAIGVFIRDYLPAAYYLPLLEEEIEQTGMLRLGRDAMIYANSCSSREDLTRICALNRPFYRNRDDTEHCGRENDVQRMQFIAQYILSLQAQQAQQAQQPRRRNYHFHQSMVFMHDL